VLDNLVGDVRHETPFEYASGEILSGEPAYLTAPASPQLGDMPRRVQVQFRSDRETRGYSYGRLTSSGPTLEGRFNVRQREVITLLGGAAMWVLARPTLSRAMPP
jgi:hypothetical protein